MEKIKVLLLEGGKRPSNQTRDELGAKGIQALPVQDLAACLAALESDNNHSVILDLDLQRAGIEAVQKIHSTFPNVAIVVLASLERLTVVDEALSQGAWDFVIKQPDLSHLQELPQAISRNEEKKRLKAEAGRSREESERLRAEAGRYQEEANKLRSALERGDGGPKEKAVDEVLADIAEDLKSPLAAMIGYLEIASTISPERAEPNQLLSIKRIGSLARRLFDLVMNHTGALDIEAGKFELQKNPFEIKQILELAVQDKQGEAIAKNVDLALEAVNDLPAISVDAVQIERALGILISNAITLSPLGGSVTVSSRLEGDRLAIAVKDSGAGIFQEEIPLLFDRRKKLRRRGADVSTVGLFVAHHIVSMHGGRIDVQSDPIEGTTLTISLPV
ncbi:MAG: HAMP domain-containing histidine kinase, partial [Deltaproteobacteria bacterium]|nr:HAMP domain-containing histidine kinase [Deltaproteobacteria bacterium]